MRRPTPCRAAIALALTLMLAAAPLFAADGETALPTWNSQSAGKLLRYGTCAFAITIASSGTGVVLAILGCAIIVADEAQAAN